jgi:endo-1,4-beta-xylanase
VDLAIINQDFDLTSDAAIRLLLSLVIAASLNAQTLRQEADRLGVKISGAVNPGKFNEPAYAQALARELNMIEPENAMKFALVHPERERFDFAGGDRIVEFASSHGMAVRGHTLVWHSQVAPWVKSGGFTPDELSSILHQHIDTVIEHYAGKVWAWDVVNEAFDGNPPRLRSTLWYDAPGIGFKEEKTKYIEQAFRWAHEADPKALLFYNDYGAETINPKSDAIYAMAKDFKARGVPLDGIGLQMHVGLKTNLSRLGENIERLTALGLQVHITELDVAIPVNPDGTPIDPDSLQKQAKVYVEIAATCLRSKGCTALQLWGVTDKYSWIPGFSKGKNGLALPLDKNYQPKPAYDALLDAFKSKR